MRRAVAVTLVIAAALTAPPPQGAPAATVAVDRSRGVDISWPECPPTLGIRHRKGQGKPLPSSTSGFVVLGLTNGPGFHVNPCLDDELAFVRAHHIALGAYAMTTFPTAQDLARWGLHGPFSGRDELGRLANAGYQEAQFNVATMRSRGMRVPFVWIDIESYCPWCWAAQPRRNAAVVRGVVAGYERSGYRVGFYSSVYMWQRILGRLGPRGLPEWRTAGASGPAAAARMCTSGGFAGGRAVMAQWWTSTKDHDLLCPAYRGSRPRRALFAPT